MDATPPSIHSFVIRFVDEPVEGEETTARGVVTHVQSAESVHFTAWDDAVRFIGRFVRLGPTGALREGENTTT